MAERSANAVLESNAWRVTEIRAQLRNAHTFASHLDGSVCGWHGTMLRIEIAELLTMAADLANDLERRMTEEGL